MYILLCCIHLKIVYASKKLNFSKEDNGHLSFILKGYSLYSKTSMINLIFIIDFGILNTMRDETKLAERILEGRGVSIVDAARIVAGIIDSMPTGSSLTKLQFCSRVVYTGLRHFRTFEKSPIEAFEEYLKTKEHLRAESISDIKYLGAKLFRVSPEFAARNFSELTRSDCQAWLEAAFKTPSQFNKGRAMLHGFFEFAFRREWCDKNPVRHVLRRKVFEREIRPLNISQVRRILEVSKGFECGAAVGLMMLAGIRPREVRRLDWSDIDLRENIVTVRGVCSKTGGVRHVEICPSLRRILKRNGGSGGRICPKDWFKRWRNIRALSGFAGRWVQDVLRHTYASFHAKRFKDLPRLQLNMGHRDISLLRSRYVNMAGISSADAVSFFDYLGGEISRAALF